MATAATPELTHCSATTTQALPQTSSEPTISEDRHSVRVGAGANEGVGHRAGDDEPQAREQQRRKTFQRDADAEEGGAPDHVQRAQGHPDPGAFGRHDARSDAAGGRPIQPQPDPEFRGNCAGSRKRAEKLC